jgi:hypothetical protein
MRTLLSHISYYGLLHAMALSTPIFEVKLLVITAEKVDDKITIKLEAYTVNNCMILLLLLLLLLFLALQPSEGYGLLVHEVS